MLRRAALAQILAQKKRLVILDEPFVGLDPPVAVEVVKLIKAVAARNKVLSPSPHALSLLLSPSPPFTCSCRLEPATCWVDVDGLRAARGV